VEGTIELNFNELKLRDHLLRGVDAAGYTSMFPIQERAIRPLLMGKDVIGQAKTGSGKTAAFGLPLLESVNTESNSVQALVLSPTRELAQQIAAELERLGKFGHARILAVYGGQSINVQLEGLKKGAHVVVGTPGRMIDHIRRGTINLQKARFVVLDEADRMLDMGFIDDVIFILNRTPEQRQLSLFSATMPNQIVKLAETYMHDPERILVDSDEPSVESLAQYYTVVEREEKLMTLLDLLHKDNPSSVLVFCRTRRGATKLAKELDRRFLNATALHGDLTQGQRDHSMKLFRTGKVDVLVATDVASRGIDIAGIESVVNFDVPEDPLVYFHRVGRTARAGNAGNSYTLVSPQEFGDFAKILRLTKVKIQPMNPDDEQHVFRVSQSSDDERRRRPRQQEQRRGRRPRRFWRQRHDYGNVHRHD
jgi:ATP-dependent RNA helicase DeaD